MPAVSCDRGVGVGGGVGVGVGAGVNIAVGKGVGAAGGGTVGGGGKGGVAAGGAGGVSTVAAGVAARVGGTGIGAIVAGGAKVGKAVVARPARVGMKSCGVAGLRRGKGTAGDGGGVTVAAGIIPIDSAGGGKSAGGGDGCRIKTQARKANSIARNAIPKQCHRQRINQGGGRSCRSSHAIAVAPLNRDQGKLGYRSVHPELAPPGRNFQPGAAGIIIAFSHSADGGQVTDAAARFGRLRPPGSPD